MGFKNATQPLEWCYKDAGGVLSINGVDVIVDMSGCGAEGMNTMAVYYQGYRAEAKFEIRSHEHNYEAGGFSTAHLHHCGLHALLLHHLRR